MLMLISYMTLFLRHTHKYPPSRILFLSRLYLYFPISNSSSGQWSLKLYVGFKLNQNCMCHALQQPTNQVCFECPCGFISDQRKGEIDPYVPVQIFGPKG